MVRVGGLRYACDPNAPHGRAHHAHALARQAASRPRKTYKVAGWAPVSEEARARGRRADLGRRGALPARAEDDQAARAGARLNVPRHPTGESAGNPRGWRDVLSATLGLAQRRVG